MTDLRELQNAVDDLMQEYSALIKPDQRTRAITASIDRFSKDKPNIVAYDITGDGGYEYSLPTTAGKEWVDNYSFIESIEYPVNSQSPQYIDEASYLIYDNGTVKKLRFTDTSIATGQTARMKYSTPWICTTTTSTIISRDAYPLACLAASFCLRMLASHFLQSTKPNLDLDVIDYSRKSVESNIHADTLENMYRDHIGIQRIGAKGAQPAPISAATATKDLDIVFPWSEDYLVHRKSWR